jgi:hypothetical protein
VRVLDIDGLGPRQVVPSAANTAPRAGPGPVTAAGDAIVVAARTTTHDQYIDRGRQRNYGPGVLAESFGLGMPTVVLPFVNAALAAHPAFQHSVAVLRDARVAVLAPSIGRKH